MDVFEGVPIGKTQRGKVIHGLFFERNWLVGGRPGQGKTSLVRTLVLGAALDPTAELWVFVIAQNTDFRSTSPLSCGFPDRRASGPCPGRGSGPAVCR
ncbi:MAG TPA: hypothetical protein VF003_06305 [Pseudonocardiaceae bacterium]